MITAGWGGRNCMITAGEGVGGPCILRDGGFA
jgi:hypothetical protein